MSRATLSLWTAGRKREDDCEYLFWISLGVWLAGDPIMKAAKGSQSMRISIVISSAVTRLATHASLRFSRRNSSNSTCFSESRIMLSSKTLNKPW